MKRSNITYFIAGCFLLLVAGTQTANAQWSLTGNAGTTPGNNFLGTTDTKALYFKTKNATRMVINSSGKVGIATSTPQSRLDVKGNLSVGSAYAGAVAAPVDGAIIQGPVAIGANSNFFGLAKLHVIDAGGSYFNVYNNFAGGGGSRLLGEWHSSGGFGAVVRYSGGGADFIDIGQGGSGEFIVNSGPSRLMTINTNGNAGFGVNPSSTYKLAVGGKIICEELKVQLQPFPDYVFEENYKLNTIPEVEAHINTYGYLPGMPSAQEVESGGLNVGQMTGKVVEKVEENTLYIIQLYKENQELKAALKSLQEQVDNLKK